MQCGTLEWEAERHHVEDPVSPAVVWMLGALAVGSVVQVVALAVLGTRLLRSWRRVSTVGERVAVDVARVQRDLAAAATVFAAASSAGNAAVARAGALTRFARDAAWMLAGMRRLGFARAAVAWGVSSWFRQRG